MTSVPTSPGDGVPAPGSATLMLLDTYGLVYRAFFALPPLSTTKGMPISAAYGFTTMLTKIIGDEKPTHIIATFDKGPPRHRIEVYAEYKAQRQEMPDDLRPQFALVRRILQTYRIPSMEIEGEEADDVIATLANLAEQAGQRCSVVTGDLDLLQIVDDATTVLVTRRGITELGRYDPAAVRERFDLEPSQLADYRGLKGDPSDNLPGIPGVGEKTASKLVRVAGSLDALLENPKLAGSAKLEQLIRQYGDQARMCRDVSVVSRTLPLTIPWDEALYRPPEPAELAPLYREFEFKTLLAKLPEADQRAAAEAAEEPVHGHYRSFTAATDPPDFQRLAEQLREAAAQERVALAHVDGEVGVATAPESGFSFAAPALLYAPAGQAFRALETGGARIVAHDAKGLAAALRQSGCEIPGASDDTMVAAHLLNPSRSYLRLGDAVSEHLALSLPGEVAAHADAVLRLSDVVRDHLLHRGQLALYDEVEMPLVAILAKMERTGIAIDPEELRTLATEVDAAIERLQSEIYTLSGETFNIGSPQQLGRILFESLKLPSGGRTKTGWATGAEVLQGLAREFDICAKVLEWREVTKLKSTYIDVLPALVGPDGRVHTIFNQTSTVTGRLSSTNPNLQNIPVRSDLGRRVRRAFVAPDPSRILLAADYSQIELRIMAHLSGDEAMREAFRRGDDIHDFTARGIFGVVAPLVPTANQRRIAKSVNFGLLYGMSEFGLAQRLEIDRAEARSMTAAYFARFPAVRDYIERNLEYGRENGYVETILGRRRYMPDLRSRHFALRSAAEREATNAPMQGSAADLMKLAMVRVDRALSDAGLDALLLLQIHDELVFEVAAAQLDEVAKLVRREMEHAIELSVPVEVTLKTGRNWYEVASYDVESVEAIEA
jgi:DNA polymerase I